MKFHQIPYIRLCRYYVWVFLKTEVRDTKTTTDNAQDNPTDKSDFFFTVITDTKLTVVGRHFFFL